MHTVVALETLALEQKVVERSNTVVVECSVLVECTVLFWYC